MKNIIVAVDGSKHAFKAVEKAKDIGRAFDCNIILVNAVNTTHYYSIETETFVMNDLTVIEAAKERSKALLEKCKQDLGALDHNITTVILEGDPAHELIDYINKSDADLVIIGSHGVKGLNRFMLGSLVSKVVHQAKMSVLIVR